MSDTVHGNHHFGRVRPGPRHFPGGGLPLDIENNPYGTGLRRSSLNFFHGTVAVRCSSLTALIFGTHLNALEIKFDQ